MLNGLVDSAGKHNAINSRGTSYLRYRLFVQASVLLMPLMDMGSEPVNGSSQFGLLVPGTPKCTSSRAKQCHPLLLSPILSSASNPWGGSQADLHFPLVHTLIVMIERTCTCYCWLGDKIRYRYQCSILTFTVSLQKEYHTFK